MRARGTAEGLAGITGVDLEVFRCGRLAEDKVVQILKYSGAHLKQTKSLYQSKDQRINKWNIKKVNDRSINAALINQSINQSKDSFYDTNQPINQSIKVSSINLISINQSINRKSLDQTYIVDIFYSKIFQKLGVPCAPSNCKFKKKLIPQRHWNAKIVAPDDRHRAFWSWNGKSQDRPLWALAGPARRHSPCAVPNSTKSKAATLFNKPKLLQK